MMRRQEDRKLFTQAPSEIKMFLFEQFVLRCLKMLTLLKENSAPNKVTV